MQKAPKGRIWVNVYYYGQINDIDEYIHHDNINILAGRPWEHTTYRKYLHVNIYIVFYHTYTVDSWYLEVDGTIFYKFKLPEVQINLHFG